RKKGLGTGCFGHVVTRFSRYPQLVSRGFLGFLPSPPSTCLSRNATLNVHLNLGHPTKGLTAKMDSTLASAHALLSQHAILTNQVRSMHREHRHRLARMQSPPRSLLSLPLLPSLPLSPPTSPPTQKRSVYQLPQHPTRPIPRPELPPAKQAKMARYPNYVPEEETIRNDYSQRYVDSGEWPQNWVQDAEPERLSKTSVPKFDAILIDPPYSSSFSWDELENLPIPTLAADPSFVFLWVGSGAGEGLEKGRAL
ncbi:hypothetical protein FRB90_012133, partial [Tulasnella sp. 427]